MAERAECKRRDDKVGGGGGGKEGMEWSSMKGKEKLEEKKEGRKRNEGSRGNYNSLPSDICRAKGTNVRSKNLVWSDILANKSLGQG